MMIDIRRDDQNYPNRRTFLEIIEDESSATYMPIKFEKIRWRKLY